MGRTLKLNWFKSCKTGTRSLCNGFTMEVRLSVAHTKLKNPHFFMSEHGCGRFFLRPTQMKGDETAALGDESPTALCSLFRCLPVFLYDVDDYKLCGVVICLTCLWKCVEARCFLGFQFDGQFRCHPSSWTSLNVHLSEENLGFKRRRWVICVQKRADGPL